MSRLVKRSKLVLLGGRVLELAIEPVLATSGGSSSVLAGGCPGRPAGNVGDVRRALDAVDDGTWGFCDVCGQPIAAERLEVRPRSTLCLKDPAAR